MIKQCSVYLPVELIQAYKDLNTHVPLSKRVNLLLAEYVSNECTELPTPEDDAFLISVPNTSDGSVL